jgi:hypothetical protein
MDITANSTIATRRWRFGKRDNILSQAEELLWKYVPPFLIVPGAIFNSLIIVVLLRHKFGKASTRTLLISLALVDTATLFVGLLRWWMIKVFNFNVRTLTNPSCPIHLFATYLFRHLASWIVVLLTLERCISVCLPLRARIVCTKKVTCIVLFMVIFLLSLLNAHFLFFTQIVYGKSMYCDSPSKDYIAFRDYIWYWLDLFTYIGLPFTIIAFCNCAILLKIIQSHADRQMLQNVGDKPECKMARQVTSMTYMLVTVSVVFIILTLPFSSQFVILSQIKDKTQQRFVYTVTYLISHVNNSINFLLYCMSGTQFRRAVYKMIKR